MTQAYHLPPPHADFVRRHRQAEARVDEQFITRWSSRAFSSEPLPEELSAALFEAARWAPSASNAQPALFLYADRDPELSRYRALVKDNNRRWADRAPLLAFVFARREHQGGTNRTAAFDAGAAWMSLALQAHRLGLIARAMGGIHRDRVHEALGVPEQRFDIMCGVAVGRPGDPGALAPDLIERERPSVRRPLAEVALRGSYREPSTPIG